MKSVRNKNNLGKVDGFQFNFHGQEGEGRGDLLPRFNFEMSASIIRHCCLCPRPGILDEHPRAHYFIYDGDTYVFGGLLNERALPGEPIVGQVNMPYCDF